MRRRDIIGLAGGSALGVAGAAWSQTPALLGAELVAVSQWPKEKRFLITDFGAIPDGISDARQAFTRAMGAAHAIGGGVVVIPSGVFLINSFEEGYYTVKPLSDVSVVGAGASSIVRIGDRLRNATQGITFLYDHTRAIAHCQYTAFTVDWNGANNLQPNPATPMSSVNRMGGSGGQLDVHFRDMLFLNAGGNHSIYLSGRSAPANPNRNCSVTGCTFRNAGQAIAGNTYNLDHSCVYMDVPAGVIRSNRFVMDNLNDKTSTAIETHQDGAVVEDNQVHGFNVGINIGADTVSARQVAVSGNSLMQVVRGIQLWNAADFRLREVTIHGNTMGIREIDYDTPFGILASAATMSGLNNGEDLRITGNTIRQLTQHMRANAAILPCALSLQRWDKVTIAGNTLSSWVAEALLVTTETGRRRLHSYVVRDNVVDGCGVTVAVPRKRVFAFNAGARAGLDDISGVQISQNQIDCSVATGSAAAIGVSFNAGMFDAVEVVNNRIDGATRTPVFKAGDCQPGQVFLVRGRGAYNPVGLIRATAGSEWTDTRVPKVYRSVDTTGMCELVSWQAVT